MSNELKIPPASYLYGEDKESTDANRKMQEAYDRLNASLDARKNRGLNPSMMALAAGFLAPTQTGGFGESLGKAAGNYAAAQQAEAKTEQETAQQQYALAGMGLQMQQQKMEAKRIADYQNRANKTGLGSTTGALSTASPSAAGPLSATGSEPVPPGPLTAAQPTQPPSIQPPTFEEFEANYINENARTGATLGKLKHDAQDLWHKQFISTASGVQNIVTGDFRPSPTGKNETIQVQGMPGTYEVPHDVAIKMSVALDKGDTKEYDRLKKAHVEGKKSIQDLALSSAKATTLAAADTEAEVSGRKDFTQKSRDADEAITSANIFRKFADEPGAEKMFGILNNSKVMSGIATLVRDGVGVPGFSIGTKSIEDVMRNANLTPAEQAKYRTFLQYAAQMQLQQSKYMKGSVSDYEQRLMGSAGINGQDTPASMRMKADLITRRAQFDRRAAKEFKNSKMTVDEFLDSDRYTEMRDNYNEDLSGLAIGGKRLVPSGKPAKNTKDMDKARTRLDNILAD